MKGRTTPSTGDQDTHHSLTHTHIHAPRDRLEGEPEHLEKPETLHILKAEISLYLLWGDCVWHHHILCKSIYELLTVFLLLLFILQQYTNPAHVAPIIVNLSLNLMKCAGGVD